MNAKALAQEQRRGMGIGLSSYILPPIVPILLVVYLVIRALGLTQFTFEILAITFLLVMLRFLPPLVSIPSVVYLIARPFGSGFACEITVIAFLLVMLRTLRR